MKNKIIIFLLFVIVTSFYSENAVDFYNKGKQAFYSENYDEAIFNYKKSLDINPNYLDSLMDLSKLYFEIENYDYSYSFISKALKLSPLNDDLIIFSANIDTKLRRYEIAENKYKKILSKNPLNISAYNGLANLYLLTNRKILAKKSLDEILKTEPANFVAISMMAKYYELIDKAKAEKYYLINIENNSLNPDSFFEYSIFCFNKNNLPKAIENIKTAINIKNKLNYKKYYGKYLLFLNQGDESLKIFQDVLKNGEINYLNFYHLAYSYYLISDYSKAKTQLLKAIGLREDDEISSFFLNQILINKFGVDDESRKERTNYYYNKATRAKQESLYDIYIFNLKEAIRLYPKNVKARIELAEYYKTLKLPERYVRELKVAAKYTNDINLADKIEIEESRISYKLGDDWNLNQYTIPQDIYSIPMFVVNEINNPHYNFEKIYGRMLVELGYDNLKFELIIEDDKNYSTSEKMNIAKEKKSPFYLDLYTRENSNSIDILLKLINSNNNQLIKDYTSYQVGNDKAVLTANTILKQLDKDVPFKGHLVKIKNDRAIINAGRRSGIKLKDNLLILNNNQYLIEIDRSKYIYNSEDVKGTAIVVKVDENISEIQFKGKNYFKDIDIDDIVIFSK